MARIDINKFALQLRFNTLGRFGQKRCAKQVRLSLETAGAITTGHPVDAKNWGATLLRIGFRQIDISCVESFIPQKGDVVVIQSTSTSTSGHIQGYDSKQWISDFLQAGFWPGPMYRKETPHVDAYRP